MVSKCVRVTFLFTFMVLVSAYLMSGSVLADTSINIVNKNRCMACHSVDKKRVGPSFKAIAKRYDGSDQAVVHLQTTIKKGSQRRWGAIPMPAQSHVSNEDARIIAQWILSLSNGN